MEYFSTMPTDFDGEDEGEGEGEGKVEGEEDEQNEDPDADDAKSVPDKAESEETDRFAKVVKKSWDLDSCKNIVKDFIIRLSKAHYDK